MRLRVHYTINGYDDSLDIEADTIEKIREIIKMEFNKRGLDPKKNNAWSEEI